MSVDLIIHAGTKFALHQWLDARGLGVNVEDIDPESANFGQYFYTHTQPNSTFYYWNHPSGKLPSTLDDTDPENVVLTEFSGFYARLSFPSVGAMPATLTSWVASNTATSILESFAGVGGEGITIVDPEDVYAHVTSIGAPVWGGLLGVGNQWSDPALWAFSSVMTNDERDFDGITYRSLINFNVWTPTQYPSGWEEVGPATDEWAAGTSYAVDDQVAYQGVTYTCLQAHTAILGWEPPNVPALWAAA